MALEEETSTANDYECSNAAYPGHLEWRCAMKTLFAVLVLVIALHAGAETVVIEASSGVCACPSRSDGCAFHKGPAVHFIGWHGSFFTCTLTFDLSSIDLSRVDVATLILTRAPYRSNALLSISAGGGLHFLQQVWEDQTAFDMLRFVPVWKQAPAKACVILDVDRRHHYSTTVCSETAAPAARPRLVLRFSE